MKTPVSSNLFDYGTLRLSNAAITDRSFVACGLSLGVSDRSVFRECTFSNIKITKCSVGFPVFDQCRFENITSDLNGVLIYGAGFKDCKFLGRLSNVVIGFAPEFVAITPEGEVRARMFQAENLDMAAASDCAIDVTGAELEFVSFRGEAIIPYVRCSRDQAVVLRADDLFERLVRLGSAQISRAKSDFFLATGVLPGSVAGIATFNPEVREFIPELEGELRGAGIEVSNYDLVR